jgi:hypothetical protein
MVSLNDPAMIHYGRPAIDRAQKWRPKWARMLVGRNVMETVDGSSIISQSGGNGQCRLCGRL